MDGCAPTRERGDRGHRWQKLLVSAWWSGARLARSRGGQRGGHERREGMHSLGEAGVWQSGPRGAPRRAGAAASTAGVRAGLLW